MVCPCPARPDLGLTVAASTRSRPSQVLALTICLAAGRALALPVELYDSVTNNRFVGPEGAYTNSAVVPVPNTDPGFIGFGYDLSGAGWFVDGGIGGKYGCALVTPRHVYEAWHTRGSGAEKAFLTRDGVVLTVARPETNVVELSMDATVGILSARVDPARVAIYPVLDLGDSANYLGSPLLMYGWWSRLGTNYVDSIGSTHFTYPSPVPGAQSMAYVQSGDSSNPDFVPYLDPITGEKKLALLGHKYSYSLDSFAPSIAPAFNAVTASNGYVMRWVAPVAQTWTGGAGNGAFTNAANWSGAVPGISNAVLFDAVAAGGQTLINLGGTQTLNGLYFKNAGGTGFTITGGVLRLGNVGLVNGSNGTLTVASAVAFNTWQYWDGGNGGIAVTGAITNHGFLLYLDGSGTNSIRGGVTGAGGLAKDGNGWLILGGTNAMGGDLFSHAGTLQVEGPLTTSQGGLNSDGGRIVVKAGRHAFGGDVVLSLGGAVELDAPSTTFQGALRAAEGAAVVRAGTNVFAGGLVIGGGAGEMGSVDVQGGMLVSSNTVTVGDAAGSTGSVVVGSAATVDFSRTNHIGYFGYGSLTVSGSAALAASTFVGYGSGGEGVLTLSGGTLVATNGAGTFTVGYEGNGRFTVAGGTAVLGGVALGTGAGGTGSVVVSGGTLLATNGGAALVVGSIASSAGNRLVVSNGGRVVYSSGGLFVGNNGARDGSVLVSGSGSVVQGAGAFNVAGSLAGSGNGVVVSNGGRIVSAGAATIGQYAGSSNNSVLITGGGSVWSNSAAFSLQGERNSLTIEKGGSLAVVGAFNFSVSGAAAGSSSNNTVIVRGSGSSLSVGQTIYVGQYGAGNNALVVSDGAQVTAASQLYLGSAGFGNRIVVSNGAQLATTVSYTYLGSGVGSDNSSVWVTGPGSLFKSSRIFLGSNGTTYGLGTSILVEDGGILETTRLTGGLAGSGSISNLGGVYRFTAAVPTITTNTSVFLLQNGVIEFLGVSTAPTTLGTITKQGTNALRLTTSTNTTAATYTVGTGREFQELHLSGANPRWAGTALLVTNGGAFVVTNAAGATVGAALTNLGATRVINSQVTYEKPVVLSGSYYSDPSTNVFISNLAVTASGSLYGSNGDLFVFHRDFLNASTNAGQFNLSMAAVLFTNAANHLLSISNSGALNLGQGFTSFAQVASNFAIGTLSIASSNRLTLAGNMDARTNALYVGWLDLQGIDTNSFASVTNALFKSLNLPSVNLYYDKYDSRNDWLNTYVPATGYDLWGGGQLLPIPEPTPLMAVACGIALLAFLRRRFA